MNCLYAIRRELELRLKGGPICKKRCEKFELDFTFSFHRI